MTDSSTTQAAPAVYGKPIRIQVPLVVDMTAEQADAYARQILPRGPQVMARQIVEAVQSCVLAAVQDLPSFGEIPFDGTGRRGATVTLKR